MSDEIDTSNILVSLRDCADELSRLIRLTMSDHSQALRARKNEFLALRRLGCGEEAERLLEQDPECFYFRIPEVVRKAGSEMLDSDKVNWGIAYSCGELLQGQVKNADALERILDKKEDPGQKTLCRLTADVHQFIRAFSEMGVVLLSSADQRTAREICALFPAMEENLSDLHRLGDLWYANHRARQTHQEVLFFLGKALR